MAKRKRGGKKKRKRFSYTGELAKYTKSEIARLNAIRHALDAVARDMALKSITR